MTNIKRDILWRVVFGMGAVVIFAGSHSFSNVQSAGARR